MRRAIAAQIKNPLAWRLAGVTLAMLGTVGLVAAEAVIAPDVRAPLAALLAVFAYSVTLLPPAARVLDHLARLMVAPALVLSGLDWLRQATDDPAWELVGIAAAVLIQAYIVAGLLLQQSVSDKNRDHDAHTANHDGPSL